MSLEIYSFSSKEENLDNRKISSFHRLAFLIFISNSKLFSVNRYNTAFNFSSIHKITILSIPAILKVILMSLRFFYKYKIISSTFIYFYETPSLLFRYILSLIKNSQRIFFTNMNIQNIFRIIHNILLINYSLLQSLNGEQNLF